MAWRDDEGEPEPARGRRHLQLERQSLDPKGKPYLEEFQGKTCNFSLTISQNETLRFSDIFTLLFRKEPSTCGSPASGVSITESKSPRNRAQ